MPIKDIHFLETNDVFEDQALITGISEVFSEQRAAMTLSELGNLYRLIKRVMHLEGDIAEVGVYLGGSAKVLALASEQRKKIHLFDTFTGIPEATANLDYVKVGDYPSSLETVKSYLQAYCNIEFHPGFFPESILNDEAMSSTKFAFVNLDVDTYVSTLNALHFFYPRLSRGAILVVHDYHCTHCRGVKRAIDEFFYDKPETLIDLWASQVAISKV